MEARNSSLTYRWIKLGEGVVGANQNVLRIDNLGHDDIELYIVLISNKFGTVYSNTVRLDLIKELGKPRLDIVFIDSKKKPLRSLGTHFIPMKSSTVVTSRNGDRWTIIHYKINDPGRTRLELKLSPELV